MSMQEVMNEHERLAILLALAAMPGYSTNDSIVQEVCARYGNDMSRDKVKTQLSWLQEQGCVTTEPVGRYVKASLTERGQDVAEGRARIPGIKRPGARA